jgi:hypothetical protein
MANKSPAPGKLDLSKEAVLQAYHMAAGKVNMSIVEHDYGSAATAVTTEMIASALVDGEVLACLLINTELAAGSTNAGQTHLLINSTQATIKSAEFAVSETVYKNVISAVTGMPQHGTEGNRQFDRGDTISAYTEAETSRTAGKYLVIMLWKER